MFRSRKIARLILLSLAVAACYGSRRACQMCEQSGKCRPPDCFCCREDLTTNGTRLKNSPQIVFFTFDDAVTAQSSEFYKTLFSAERRNPNGCSIKMTLFVSHNYTDYTLVKHFHRRGMEIASHSVNHVSNLSPSEMRKEMFGQKENIARLAQIPKKDIVGWRSPFLKPFGDNQVNTLIEGGYQYDATLTFSKRHNKAPFPFTLDFGWPYNCQINDCPKRPHPGFWEIPVVSLNDKSGQYDCVYVDGCNFPPSNEQEAFNFLWKNFQNYYQGTRAPFGINMHAAWFFYNYYSDPFRLKAMGRFIDEILKLGDVYILTLQQMIDWLKNPVEIADLDKIKSWKCPYEQQSRAQQRDSPTGAQGSSSVFYNRKLVNEVNRKINAGMDHPAADSTRGRGRQPYSSLYTEPRDNPYASDSAKAQNPSTSPKTAKLADSRRDSFSSSDIQNSEIFAAARAAAEKHRSSQYVGQKPPASDRQSSPPAGVQKSQASETKWQRTTTAVVRNPSVPHGGGPDTSAVVIQSLKYPKTLATAAPRRSNTPTSTLASTTDSSVCLQGVNCRAPDCHCENTDFPLALSLDETPQIVYFTFDGDINNHFYRGVNSLFDLTRRNPDNCQIKATFFVSDVGTNYKLVQNLRHRGMEIGLRGKTTTTYTNRTEMYEDILEQKKKMIDASIPANDIKGWRSPGMKPMGDVQMAMLKELGLEYDATLISQPFFKTSTVTWPFTLDFGWTQPCIIDSCPTKNFPGLWEVPANPFLDSSNYTCIYADGCLSRPLSDKDTLHLLWLNFEQHYKTNKAPYGIRLQHDWFHWNHHANLRGLNEFIFKLLDLPDVFIFNVREMIDWIKQPKSLAQMKMQTC